MVDLAVLDTESELGRLRRRVADLERQIATCSNAVLAHEASERRFQSLVENMRGVVFYRSDENGDFQVYGADAPGIFGDSATGGKADLAAWHATIHPDDRERYLAQMRRRRRDGIDLTVEFRYTHPVTGKLIWARERAYVVMTPTGQRFNDGYILDVTPEKELEAQLREATQTAIMANRAKSEFLANMSHELRTPLNAIIGFAEIMTSESMGPIGSARYAEYCRDIHISANHLLTLIEDILDLSKAESGQAELMEALVDIERTIESAVRMVREKAQNRRISLTTAIDPKLPQLRADERKLRQILLNLLSNALKFTPEDGFVTVHAEQRQDGGVTISVADTGIGMAKEDIPRALQAFVQLHTGLGRHFEGTGLGLPLSRKLAELHGGVLEVESQPEAGTVVRLAMPEYRSVRPQSGA